MPKFLSQNLIIAVKIFQKCGQNLARILQKFLNSYQRIQKSCQNICENVPKTTCTICRAEKQRAIVNVTTEENRLFLKCCPENPRKCFGFPLVSITFIYKEWVLNDLPQIDCQPLTECPQGGDFRLVLGPWVGSWRKKKAPKRSKIPPLMNQKKPQSLQASLSFKPFGTSVARGAGHFKTTSFLNGWKRAEVFYKKCKKTAPPPNKVQEHLGVEERVITPFGIREILP